MNIAKIFAFSALMSLGLQAVQAAGDQLYKDGYSQVHEKKEATDGFDLLMRNIWIKLGLLAGPEIIIGAWCQDVKVGLTYFGVWLTGMALYHAKSEAKRLAD